MNEITLENIQNLKAIQLTQLLLKLLHLEYKKYDFPHCYINVPQNITTADGGEDGRINTTDFRESRWIKNNYCLFQSKATKMGIPDCKKEILKETKGKKTEYELKSQLNEVFENNGTYILFTTDAYVENNLNQRVAALREAIELAKGKEFAEKCKIEIYDANLIRDWTNEYISAISYVQHCFGITKPNGLLIWEELKSYINNSNSFKSNSEIDSIIDQVRNDILAEKKNIRIEGVSGIGKTRLICEALSPGEKDSLGNFDINRKSISDSVIYFDIGIGNHQNVIDFVRSSVSNYPAILVLDNCEPIYHDSFLNEVQRGNSLIKLITIDYEKCNSRSHENCKIIELKSSYFNSVVEEILKEKYANQLNDVEIKYLIEFSDGNPKMAIQFVKAALQNLNLSDSFDDKLLEKLIFGRSAVNHIEFQNLKLFSVFKYFEFPDDSYFSINESHYKQLLEHSTFFTQFLKSAPNDVRLVLKKYLEKGILERRGNKIVIRPNPLSLKLSLIFWDELPPYEYQNFIESIPQTLISPLTEQLQLLGNVGNAKHLVEITWGVNGNFSTAEILNSRIGSQLFRSVATVNPKEIIKVFVKHYLDKPKSYLESIKEGRQNLVWALERLCYREETFTQASQVLMCFAAAEIETYYSNNSTHYFTQLFRILLAGTEVNFEPRINVLKWALNKNDDDFNLLILKASERAFTPSHNLHKMLGAENQGGLVPLIDYRPKSPDEINNYRKEIIEILMKFVETENPHQLAAQRIIYNNVHDLFEFNFNLYYLKRTLNIIITKIVDRNDMIKSLYNQISMLRLNGTQRDFISEFIDSLKTNSIEERILYNVSEPKFIIKTSRDENEFDNKGKIIAEKFAQDIINEGIDLKPYFVNLLTGNQYHAFDFGKKLCDLKGYDENFINQLLEEALLLEGKSFNISFLYGFVSALSNKQILKIFNDLIDKRSSFSFFIFRLLEIDFSNVLKLINLLKESDISPENLNIIKHEIIQLNYKDLINYFKVINQFDNGPLIIFETFHHYLWNIKNDEEIIPADLLSYLKTVIEKSNLLLVINNSNILNLYSWEKIVDILLEKFKNELTITISHQIVEYIASSIFSRGDYEIAKIANKTLYLDFDNCWSIYYELVKNKNLTGFWDVFNMSFISGTGAHHPFFSDEKRNKKLFEWLKTNSEAAPWIIRVAPLFAHDSTSWFPFTKTLIDFFGDDEDFISELSCNLHSMFTSGSRVPYLVSRKNLVEELKVHLILRVRNWAQAEIENYEKEIKIEQISDEEGFLGW
ncbi:hypothetical protein [Flavobacterium sp. ACN6]|uniref:hypothetical protein n=1 Tax=Flavobacterium sp. ACN6 TaxID=1920426 RepID=UPI000BB3AEEF|nr:hypothetical protein [Flavobacterium sp. ACN6]PBJ14317.1 hypothetical protein BSF42_07340 [Flavobacterium sp. ACN6]